MYLGKLAQHVQVFAGLVGDRGQGVAAFDRVGLRFGPLRRFFVRLGRVGSRAGGARPPVAGG